MYKIRFKKSENYYVCYLFGLKIKNNYTAIHKITCLGFIQYKINVTKINF